MGGVFLVFEYNVHTFLDEDNSMEKKPSPDAVYSSRVDTDSVILTFCVISAYLIYLVYTQNIVFGSAYGHWVYPYFAHLQHIPVWIPGVVLLSLILLIFVGGRLIFSYEKMTLLGCFPILVMIQLWIHAIYPYHFGDIVESNIDTTFYSIANQYSPLQILNQFVNLVVSFPMHAGSNMAGKILLFHFLSIFTKSPQTMGDLIVWLSTLGAPLIYGICKILFNDRRTAYYAFILYAIIPSKIFFLPILNTFTPVFILGCLYLFLLYIETRKVLFLMLLGVALYMLILFEPSPLVTGIIFLGILVNAIIEKKVLIKDLWKIPVFPILAFLVVHGIFVVVFSFNLFQAFQIIANAAVRFNAEAYREYRLWVWENCKEFFYAVGLPIMMIFIYSVAQIIRQIGTTRLNFTKWQIEKSFIISLLITFGTVVLLGINRGEITRLWIYLAVFFVIPAAFLLGKKSRSNILFLCIASTLVVQIMITLQRVAFEVP
jgi:hypothetical protein